MVLVTRGCLSVVQIWQYGAASGSTEAEAWPNTGVDGLP